MGIILSTMYCYPRMTSTTRMTVEIVPQQSNIISMCMSIPGLVVGGRVGVCSVAMEEIIIIVIFTHFLNCISTPSHMSS